MDTAAAERIERAVLSALKEKGYIDEIPYDLLLEDGETWEE